MLTKAKPKKPRLRATARSGAAWARSRFCARRFERGGVMKLQTNLLSISTAVLERCSLTQLKRCSWMLLLGAAVYAHTQNLSEFSSLERHMKNEVTVETEQGERIRGDLLRVEQNRIVVYAAGAPKAIARESIKTVTRHKSRHTTAWVLGMSATGLGIGLLAGFSQFDGATNANSKITGTALGLAGVGAAAGFGISRLGKTQQVIYQSDSGTGTRH
jgi:hypothetical protein